MKKYNTLSGMPQIQFNKGEKKFEAMNPKDDKVVESMYGTYVKPKSKQSKVQNANFYWRRCL